MDVLPEELEGLPDEIIKHIISFMEPVDVMRWAQISQRHRNFADSNEVWNQFLIENCRVSADQEQSFSAKVKFRETPQARTEATMCVDRIGREYYWKWVGEAALGKKGDPGKQAYYLHTDLILQHADVREAFFTGKIHKDQLASELDAEQAFTVFESSLSRISSERGLFLSAYIKQKLGPLKEDQIKRLAHLLATNTYITSRYFLKKRKSLKDRSTLADILHLPKKTKGDYGKFIHLCLARNDIIKPLKVAHWPFMKSGKGGYGYGEENYVRASLLQRLRLNFPRDIRQIIHKCFKWGGELSYFPGLKLLHLEIKGMGWGIYKVLRLHKLHWKYPNNAPITFGRGRFKTFTRANIGLMPWTWFWQHLGKVIGLIVGAIIAFVAIPIVLLKTIFQHVGLRYQEAKMARLDEEIRQLTAKIELGEKEQVAAVPTVLSHHARVAAMPMPAVAPTPTSQEEEHLLGNDSQGAISPASTENGLLPKPTTSPRNVIIGRIPLQPSEMSTDFNQSSALKRK